MELIRTSDSYDEEPLIGKNKVEHGLKSKICQRFFPSGFKRELTTLLKIGFPCIFTAAFRVLNPMISLIMCGHLNKLKFDAASLANSIINILGVCIDLGFSTAFDTLFAQIYGCDQKKKMGAILQRAMIIMTLLYLVLACLHLNIEPLLILLKQDPEVAELAAKYIAVYLPGLFFDFQFVTISRYLQNQNSVYPMMVSAFIGDVFSAVSQYIAIYVLGYDLEASAVLQGVSCFIMFACQLAYIIISKMYKDSWDGFSLKAALSNWKVIFLLGLPGILSIALEAWNYEIGTLIAGTLNRVQLGAQSIAFQCGTMAFMLSMGLGISVAIRIGQYLGSRDVDRIKTCLNTAVVLAFCSSSFSCIFILIFRNYITQLFSNDPEIQSEGATLLIFIACNQFFDVVAGVTSGILKACGRQATGAVIMFISYYILGVPLGVVLVYVVKINIKGMWIGLMSALFVEGSIFIFLISRTNWEEECNKANRNVDNVEITDSREDSDWTEKKPLIVKSDVEDNVTWKDDSIFNEFTMRRKKTQRRATSYSENCTVIANRRRTMFLITPAEIKLEPEEPFRRILIKRVIAIVIVALLFVGALLLRTYLPKSVYFPVTNNTVVP